MNVPQGDIDLRSLFPAVRNQGPRGTCLAFAVTSCHEASRGGGGHTAYSEEALYWEARRVGSHSSGVSIQSVTTALQHPGQPEAHRWPYDTQRDESAQDYTPPADALLPANCFQGLLSRVAANPSVVANHVRQGRPVVLVVTVSGPFFVAPMGRIAVPQPGEVINDHHAVLAVGVDTKVISTGCFIVRNSWGIGWGDAGYGYLPFEYLQRLGIAAGLVQPI